MLNSIIARNQSYMSKTLTKFFMNYQRAYFSTHQHLDFRKKNLIETEELHDLIYTDTKDLRLLNATWYIENNKEYGTEDHEFMRIPKS
jgi:hypothetical protein